MDQQLTSIAEGMKTGFEEIKALLATHSTEFETLEREVRSSHHMYNNNTTIA